MRDLSEILEELKTRSGEIASNPDVTVDQCASVMNTIISKGILEVLVDIRDQLYNIEKNLRGDIDDRTT